jgi:hypothetical protein
MLIWRSQSCQWNAALPFAHHNLPKSWRVNIYHFQKMECCWEKIESFLTWWQCNNYDISQPGKKQEHRIYLRRIGHKYSGEKVTTFSRNMHIVRNGVLHTQNALHQQPPLISKSKCLITSSIDILPSLWVSKKTIHIDLT